MSPEIESGATSEPKGSREEMEEVWLAVLEEELEGKVTIHDLIRAIFY